MVKRKAKVIPLLPLEPGNIFLPGVNHRISTFGRPDVAALLSRIHDRGTLPSNSSLSSTSRDNIIIGCIPLKSPYMSRDGKKLIRSGAETDDNDDDAGADTAGNEHGNNDKVPGREEEFGKGRGRKERLIERATETVNVNDVRGQDLYGYGVLSKVIGVQSNRRGEMILLVEGISRFEVKEVLQERPYFEAKVVVYEDEGIKSSDVELRSTFAELKRVSHQLFTLSRLSFLLPRSLKSSMTPLLARRLEMYLAKKDSDEAGLATDVLITAVDATFEEKAQVLAAVSVKERLELALDILERLLTNIKGNGRILSISTDSLTSPVKEGQGLDLDQLQKLQQGILLGKLSGKSPGNGGNLPKSFGIGSRPAAGGDDINEIDELGKRLNEAKLSPEAEKVANREIQRLQRMNPAQAEYQVCRNYLETLAEIPWSQVTKDRLEAATLERARKQLNDDHYGLEKIKKRLLEYLAVLRLKQTVNSRLQGEIEKISDLPPAKDSSISSQQKTVPVDQEKKKAREKLIEQKRMIDKSPILLLVGPPGTGKTSLAKSVATALGRKFHRISLGGVRDEAEIRGHRRTYVAAMPGLIISGLKKVGVANPVFLLDEIDKLGMSNFHGDPSAAMLEVLDPEQNHTFSDHYLNIPFDLSKVLFIATANSLDTIPPPLLDRMETISLPGYTTLEKQHIAARHLLPKQILTNGLSSDSVHVPSEVLDKIITAYTREAGVRSLERELAALCRAKAVEYSESLDPPSLKSSYSFNSTVPSAIPAASDTSATHTPPKPYDPHVTLSDLEPILGPERYEQELAAISTRPGVVTGLVAYSSGAQGSILFIEMSDFPASGSSSGGALTLTGQLGDVLKESVSVALTWVRAHAVALGLTDDPDADIMRARALHVHCPAGAVPKDGPSAGLAHTVALISLFSGRSVPSAVAMTGEVSLRGKVTPVGGIKEKLIGALRAGVKTVLLPQGNRKDAKDLPDEVKNGLEVVFVGHIWDSLKIIWPETVWPGEKQDWSGIDSRL